MNASFIAEPTASMIVILRESEFQINAGEIETYIHDIDCLSQMRIFIH